MIAADHELLTVATQHAEATLRLVDALRTARAWQWDKTPASRTVTAVGVTDPTGEVATSTSRLTLRARVLDSLAAIKAATASFDTVADALTTSLETHQTPALLAPEGHHS